jgi:hypothetical protein
MAISERFAASNLLKGLGGAGQEASSRFSGGISGGHYKHIVSQLQKTSKRDLICLSHRSDTRWADAKGQRTSARFPVPEGLRTFNPRGTVIPFAPAVTAANGDEQNSARPGAERANHSHQKGALY